MKNMIELLILVVVLLITIAFLSPINTTYEKVENGHKITITVSDRFTKK